MSVDFWEAAHRITQAASRITLAAGKLPLHYPKSNAGPELESYMYFGFGLSSVVCVVGNTPYSLQWGA